jgi:hypothetical protein
MNHHMETNTNTNTKRACVPVQVRFDEVLLLRYASSLMRLLIFMNHCGPDHPCTVNETRLFRRYDGAVVARHVALNVQQAHSMIMRALADRLVNMSRDVVVTFDLEPEFASEILADFAKMVGNRFSI